MTRLNTSLPSRSVPNQNSADGASRAPETVDRGSWGEPRALGQALRPRRAYVVLDQNFEQRGPRQPRDHPRGEEPQRQTGKHQGAQSLRPRGREPAQPEREHEDQQETEPEEWQRHPCVGEHPTEPVDPRALVERGHHPGGYSDDHREQDAAEAEGER